MSEVILELRKEITCNLYTNKEKVLRDVDDLYIKSFLDGYKIGEPITIDFNSIVDKDFNYDKDKTPKEIIYIYTFKNKEKLTLFKLKHNL